MRRASGGGFSLGRLNLYLGVLFIGVLVLAALVSFVWLPYDPQAMNFASQLAKPSLAHPLGADHFGRDLLSRTDGGAVRALRGLHRRGHST